MATSTMDVIAADGFRIPVTELGLGRPILIVHPGGGTSASWAGVAGHLAKRFRVLRFDRRPYRLPGDAELTATMENEVNDVLAITAAAGEPVVPRAPGQRVDSRQGRAHHRALRRQGAAHALTMQVLALSIAALTGRCRGLP